MRVSWLSATLRNTSSTSFHVADRGPSYLKFCMTSGVFETVAWEFVTLFRLFKGHTFVISDSFRPVPRAKTGLTDDLREIPGVRCSSKD